MPGGEHATFEIFSLRQNRRHPGANRRFPVAGNQSRVADFDAFDIRYRVKLSGRAVKRYAQISGSRIGLRGNWYSQKRK